MIDLKIISNYFDASLRDNPSFSKHIFKEYVQLMVLDHLSDSPYFRKLSFIGGTNLRLIKGIDRFSEDLDFDVHDMERGRVHGDDRQCRSFSATLRSQCRASRQAQRTPFGLPPKYLFPATAV